MSQATSTSITRRGALHFLAAAPIAAAIPYAALPLMAPTDPIFAAIEVHKTALGNFKKAIDRWNSLEASLPKELRQSSFDADELTIVETDDSRWVVSEREVHEASEAETEASIVLLIVKPTTIAGVLALVQYAHNHTRTGHEWPNSLVENQDEIRSRDWSEYMFESLAEALTAIVASGGKAVQS